MIQAHGQSGSNQKSTRELAMLMDNPACAESAFRRHAVGATWLDRAHSPTKGFHHMAPPNLTRADAQARAALLQVADYTVELDLTDGGGTSPVDRRSPPT